MAEALRAAWPDLPSFTSGERARVSLAGPVARLLFRGDREAGLAIGPALGVALPREPCRAESHGDHAALWLGPDEWLLIGPESEAENLFAACRAALGEAPHALVDISDRDAAFSLEGPAAALLLNAGLPLDLDAFAVGMCARSVFAKVSVLLWKQTPDRFRLETARSHAAHVWGLLEAASRALPP